MPGRFGYHSDSAGLVSGDYWIYPFTWALSSAVYVVLLKRIHVDRLGGAV